MSGAALPLAPIFPTLRSVGFTTCMHPRVRNERICQDCGAIRQAGLWIGGSLDYGREPWIVVSSS